MQKLAFQPVSEEKEYQGHTKKKKNIFILKVFVKKNLWIYQAKKSGAPEWKESEQEDDCNARTWDLGIEAHGGCET